MARIIEKKPENEPKKTPGRVVTPKIRYFYTHLYTETSPKAGSFEAFAAKNGLPVEVSAAPSGCKSYRIDQKHKELMYKKRNSEVLFFPIKGSETDFPAFTDDNFWYLHKEWSPIVLQTISKSEEKSKSRSRK